MVQSSEMLIISKTMNLFRMAGDSYHMLAIVILLIKILKTKSCAGVSGKSQILFATTYLCRYLDLFVYFVSYYNSVFKILYIAISLTTCYLIFGRFNATYDRKNDTFWIEMLIIPAFVLVCFYNHNSDPLELLWTFSIYLESVAILPQLVLVWKIGKVDSTIWCYLVALCSYRAFYILNWAYRYLYEDHLDLISVNAGVVQTMLYLVFFILYGIRRCCSNKTEEFSYLIDEAGEPAYIISGKYTLDMGKSDIKIQPVFKEGGKTTLVPIDEVTPKTGLASFAEFAMNLTSVSPTESISESCQSGVNTNISGTTSEIGKVNQV